MSKNKKSQKPKKNVVEAKAPSVSAENVSAETMEVTEKIETVEPMVENKVDKKSKAKQEKDNKKDKDLKDKSNKKNAKAKGKKEKGKLKRKTKETMSELKKVTWPTFGEVCKKTGVVLVVVLVFAVVIFGIDYCLGLLVGLLK